ncbi:MAG: IS66 family insertion sequence element accessory protein TnpB [Desulfitobacteriaceae bacterium]
MSLNAAGLRIFLSCKPCDMRKSIEGLATLVQTQLQMDPFNNCLYVFCNRTCDKCKILHWSNNGWWLYYRK